MYREHPLANARGYNPVRQDGNFAITSKTFLFPSV
jgi:hypothetical protein